MNRSIIIFRATISTRSFLLIVCRARVHLLFAHRNERGDIFPPTVTMSDDRRPIWTRFGRSIKGRMEQRSDTGEARQSRYISRAIVLRCFFNAGERFNDFFNVAFNDSLMLGLSIDPGRSGVM